MDHSPRVYRVGKPYRRLIALFLALPPLGIFLYDLLTLNPSLAGLAVKMGWIDPGIAYESQQMSWAKIAEIDALILLGLWALVFFYALNVFRAYLELEDETIRIRHAESGKTIEIKTRDIHRIEGPDEDLRLRLLSAKAATLETLSLGQWSSPQEIQAWFTARWPKRDA